MLQDYAYKILIHILTELYLRQIRLLSGAIFWLFFNKKRAASHTKAVRLALLNAPLSTHKRPIYDTQTALLEV